MLSILSKYSQLPAELPLHSVGVDAGGHDTAQYDASVLGSSERFLKIKNSINKKSSKQTFGIHERYKGLLHLKLTIRG